MDIAHRPAKRITFAVTLTVLALAVSSCAGGLIGANPAATVNGTEISPDEVEESMAVRERFLNVQIAAAQAQLDAQGGGEEDQAALDSSAADALAPYDSENAGTTPTEGAALLLTELIQLQLLRDAMAGAGLELGDGELAAARSAIESQLQVPLEDVPEGFLARQAELSARDAALRQDIPDELSQALAQAGTDYEAQLEGAYEQAADSLQQACGRALVAPSQAEAQAGLARVNGGESFDDVAAELSGIDVAQASQPQCLPAASFSEVFTEADAAPAVGDIVGPSDAGGTWVVFVVDSFGTQTFEEARETLASQLPDEGTPIAQEAIESFLSERLVGDADVEVDPRYGTWDPETLSVVPPDVPGTIEPPSDGPVLVPGN